MKKLTKEQIKILSIIIAVVIVIILAISIISLVKTIKNKKTVQEVSNLDNNIIEEELVIDENDTTEINIEDLKTIEEEEAKDKEKEKATKTSNSNSKYYIKINYTANVVTIYTKDNKGEYTVPYKAMVCSTGSGTPRSGTYAIKSRWRWGALFGGVYGQYCVHITGNILFHSVPYLSKSQDSLEYWEYDKLRNICINGMH